MNVSKLRDDRTLAHVVPMVLFMVVGGVLLLVTGSMESVFRKHEFLPWWRSSPEHWIYPLQTLVAGRRWFFGGSSMICSGRRGRCCSGR